METYLNPPTGKVVPAGVVTMERTIEELAYPKTDHLMETRAVLRQLSQQNLMQIRLHTPTLESSDIPEKHAGEALRLPCHERPEGTFQRHSS
jgi:hypothetical protein